jgi:plastocyanin
MTRKIVLLVAALAALAVPVPAAAADQTVTITAAGFVPASVTIDAGDTVTWRNVDTAAHSVVADDGAFASGLIQPGQSFSFTFRQSGTFRYRDGTRRNERGTVVVRTSVTLAVAPRAVVYGGKVTLSGRISSGQSGQQVIIIVLQCGQAAETRAATVTTTANGEFTFQHQPLANSTYHVRWRTTDSAKIQVRVAPRVLLSRIARGRFTARVRAAQSFVGKFVLFQRFNATLRRWVIVRRATLTTTQASVAPTITSVVTFRARVRARLRVRVVLPQTQASPCYLTSRSGTIRS